MTTTTIYGSTADGNIQSSSATYSTARSGGGTLVAAAAGTADVGQNVAAAVYYLYEGFIQFDTSSIPDNDTITAVELSLYVYQDSSTTDFTVNARLYDWGAALTSADWVAGASASGNTLAATLATSGATDDAYNAFTSEDAFKANINKTGTTYLVLTSSRFENGDVPTGDERLLFRSGSYTGTTYDPKLVVTHSSVPTGSIASSLQPLTSALAGVHEQTGTATGNIQPLTAAVVGHMDAVGTISVSIQPLTCDATDHADNTIRSVMRPLTCAATGVHKQVGTATGSIQPLTCAIAASYLGIIQSGVRPGRGGDALKPVRPGRGRATR